MPETKKIFDEVARHYDWLNTLFSLGIHKLWRKKLAEQLRGTEYNLDIATGTAEVAIEVAKKHPSTKTVGIDPSMNMLRIAKKKIEDLDLGEKVALVSAAAENLPFAEKQFDSATIAFGIRNTVDYELSLKEIRRVLRESGKLLILEFAIPRNPVFKPLYMFYFRVLMPLVGSIYGRGKEYRYLAESAASFPQRKEFLQHLENAGFRDCRYSELTMGVVVLYSATR
ncbi:MAG: bifunctional demethylmenaquinone methyltransferase/2-methoxy-6-polyprenyl-1,4-benzoquinol methylase UbiE [Candidatus Dadabacteria bacterium]|nr:bifunctional demethylmenaquinone methyltransferase/2-methoxy-6-polyprenyl-1,4-benzoquinol methylase UbiE [Candidatus Dadabacteria bacterium]MYA48301.1 bifunctional demethylmenaquinone methyltransferase/2-methoxy-6-polyprenyl-1,4-benzoquinol methylase UbiE [Candidatus Dadabacteria bacterium]MYG83245.1 bifunctional demethylmenaquinone methyltransferase/2-methoxy-6-polyprenyl-1,4-benzoquinol methylase UbiE [Candidatus Dadabacteria bacterium]MYK48987.1 bifunctional demethylmenaquinone methyltrans